MRTRSDDAHTPFQDVEKLWYLVYTESAKQSPCRKNLRISGADLPWPFSILRMHGSKLQDLELMILDPGACLPVEQWAWRLESLKHFDYQGCQRKSNQSS